MCRCAIKLRHQLVCEEDAFRRRLAGAVAPEAASCRKAPAQRRRNASSVANRHGTKTTKECIFYCEPPRYKNTARINFACLNSTVQHRKLIAHIKREKTPRPMSA